MVRCGTKYCTVLYGDGTVGYIAVPHHTIIYYRIACLHMPAGASSYLERLIGGPISSYSVRYDVLVRHGTQRHSKIVVSVFYAIILVHYATVLYLFIVWCGMVRCGTKYCTVLYGDGTVGYIAVPHHTCRLEQKSII